MLMSSTEPLLCGSSTLRGRLKKTARCSWNAYTSLKVKNESYNDSVHVDYDCEIRRLAERDAGLRQGLQLHQHHVLWTREHEALRSEHHRQFIPLQPTASPGQRWQASLLPVEQGDRVRPDGGGLWFWALVQQVWC